MDGLETSIVNISEDALDDLFDETPDKTVSADTLIGGQKGAKSKQPKAEDDFEDVEDDEEEDETPKQKQKNKAVPKQPKVKEQPQAIVDLDDEELEEYEEEETEEDEEEEEQDEKPKKKKAQVPPEEDEDASDKSEVKSVLKNTMDYLIKQGRWEDFEGREELELDEETYGQIALAQDERRLSKMFNEMVDGTGPFGKAIIDFVKNGGNPDEIIDLFKEQKQVGAINIESIDGQKDIIKHYYTEVMGWKPERAEKYLSNLVLSNELESEAQEVKELFNSYYQKEAGRLNQEREQAANRQREAEEAFESNIRSAVKDRKDLTPAEKKNVEDYLLRYDQKLANGNTVNKFYVNFAKMQANPADYVDLVLFVMDKQKFVQKVATKEKSQAAANAFQFIKGNGAVSSKKGSNYEQVKKNEKVSGFDWGFGK
jgi:hypothetical protein